MRKYTKSEINNFRKKINEWHDNKNYVKKMKLELNYILKNLPKSDIVFFLKKLKKDQINGNTYVNIDIYGIYGDKCGCFFGSIALKNNIRITSLDVCPLKYEVRKYFEKYNIKIKGIENSFLEKYISKINIYQPESIKQKYKIVLQDYIEKWLNKNEN